MNDTFPCCDWMEEAFGDYIDVHSFNDYETQVLAIFGNDVIAEIKYCPHCGKEIVIEAQK